jgi:hypothetical protein
MVESHETPVTALKLQSAIVTIGKGTLLFSY